MDSDLQRAIELIKSGKRSQGGRLLSEILKKDPRNMNAWLWLSSCVDSNEKKIYCLKKALEIDPNHEVARVALSKIQTQVKEPSEKEILGVDPQLTKLKIASQTKTELSSKQAADKGTISKTVSLLLIAIVTISVICIIVLAGIFVTIPRISSAGNPPQSQQISSSKQPTTKPLPTVTLPPTLTPQPVILPGPARRYVPITNEGMAANYQYPIIDEYRLDDGDYYQIKFQALDGVNIIYEEPSYFFFAFVGDTVDNAIKKYREINQEFQADSNNWNYEWGENTYSGPLFAESGQYIGYKGFYVESGRIFRIDNVVVLITVGIRNLDGISDADINRTQQELDKFTAIIEQKFR